MKSALADLILTVQLFEINTEKGHGGPSKNRTTKTSHLNGKL
jgi:hypothetical protein